MASSYLPLTTREVALDDTHDVGPYPYGRPPSAKPSLWRRAVQFTKEHPVRAAVWGVEAVCVASASFGMNILLHNKVLATTLCVS